MGKYTTEIFDPLEGIKEFAVVTFLDTRFMKTKFRIFMNLSMATGEVSQMVIEILNNDPNSGYIPSADVPVIKDKNKSLLWEDLNAVFTFYRCKGLQ